MRTFRNKLVLITFFFNFFSLTTFAQYFEWAKRAGWYAFDLGYGTCTDNAGNVYIAGKYEMNASFGNTRVGCKGNHDIYVAKYSPSGAFLWVRTAGGTIGDYAHAVTCDGAGNVYLTGEFETTTFFGSVSMKSSGNNDVFLAKYNTNGDLQWAKKLGGGGGNDRGLGISIVNGNIYISGRFQGTAIFSGIKMVSSGGTDIFIAKCNSNGVLQWLRKAGGPGEDEGNAITTDAAGNAYVTGFFSRTANFSGTYVTSKGGSDIFIAKYGPDGGVHWVKGAGAGANDYGMGIMADNAGRVFLTGGFRYTTNFGAATLKSVNGNADIFVACYNSSGANIWARKAGGGQNDYGRAIDVDGSSNIYITGNFGNTATFGNKTITGADATEIYVASYTASGNFRWVLQAGGVKDKADPDRFIEMGLSISVDNSRNVYASGTYRSASTFGGTTLAPWDHTEVFLAKIRQGSAVGASAARARISRLSASITPSDTVNICPGESVLLKTNPDSGCTYSWKKDEQVIPGIDSSEYSASQEGNYTVTKINDSDTATSAQVVVVFKNCNLKDHSLQTDSLTGTDNALSLVENDSLLMKIYPNPNSGLFTIEVNLVSSAENTDVVTVEIISSSGQLVYRKESSYAKGLFKEQIELEKNVPLGIYFLQVTYGNKVEKTKMMLMR